MSLRELIEWTQKFQFSRLAKKTVIESPKCEKCGAELPIGVRYLHGMPHTYTLPCPKCTQEAKSK